MSSIIGQKFGRWEVIAEIDSKDRKKVLCKCDCSNEKIVLFGNLKKGLTKSCGCLNKELTSERQLIHGHNKRKGTSSEYQAWNHIKSRCCNINDKNYGGRGIKVCDRWKDSFVNFLEDMGPKPEPKKDYSIDRIDNNGNYEPRNCRWAILIEQANNKRSNVLVEFNGESLTIAEWARKLDTSYKALYHRFERGWPVEKALTTPMRKSNKFN